MLTVIRQHTFSWLVNMLLTCCMVLRINRHHVFNFLVMLCCLWCNNVNSYWGVSLKIKMVLWLFVVSPSFDWSIIAKWVQTRGSGYYWSIRQVFEEFVMLLSWKAVTLHFYFWFLIYTNWDNGLGDETSERLYWIAFSFYSN